MLRTLGRVMLVASACGIGGESHAQQPLRIVINIPAFRLDVYSAGAIIRTMPVAVGMPRYMTPHGEFAITRIEWNPWWIPPDRGWAAKEHVTPPGPDNPMGRVKLYFRPLYFIHGTPVATSLGRAASHGCVRMSNADAVELARMVALAAASAEDRSRLGSIVADTATRVMALDPPVSADLRYDLAEVRRDSLFVYRDIYGLRAVPMRDLVYAALVDRAVDTSIVDEGRVVALTRRIPARGRGVPLDSLRTRPRAGNGPVGNRAPTGRRIAQNGASGNPCTEGGSPDATREPLGYHPEVHDWPHTT